jgi:hypothetical protein
MMCTGRQRARKEKENQEKEEDMSEKEDMRMISKKFGIFFIGDQPLPPRLVVESEAEIIIRLESTRSGMSARWLAGEKAREAMNQSPYCPQLRAVVKQFEWEPPDTKDCPSSIARMGEELADDEVRQLGSGILNWRAHVVRPLEDPLKEVFERVLNLPEEVSGAPIKQGALEIRGIPEWIAPGFDSQIPLGGSGNKWFMNHALLGVDKFAWRVPRGTSQAVAVVKFYGGWILSPDHPSAPLRVEGWYVLTHPIPTNGVD